MHTPTLYKIAAGVVTFAWVGYLTHSFHTIVKTFGSYPHDIQLDGTYWEKVRYTLTERVKLKRMIAVNLTIIAALNVAAVVVTAGLVHLL